MAILDRFPACLGHTLIIPKVHAEDLFNLPDAHEAALMPLAREMAGVLRRVTGCAGLNLVQNNGRAAGQEIGHFHLHLIPRFDGDGIKFNLPRLDPAPGDFTAFLEKCRG
jgi:histidine triad (HIT) family protein